MQIKVQAGPGGRRGRPGLCSYTRQQFFVQMLTELASDSSLHLTEFASLCNVAAAGEHSGKELFVQ